MRPTPGVPETRPTWWSARGRVPGLRFPWPGFPVDCAGETESAVPLLVLILVSCAAGLLTAAIVWRYPRSLPGDASATPVAEAVADAAVQHRGVRAFVRRRRDPVAATGLAL